MPSTYQHYSDLRDRLEIFRLTNNDHKKVYFPPYSSNLIQSQIIQSIANRLLEYTKASSDVYSSTGQIPSVKSKISCYTFAFDSNNRLSVNFRAFISVIPKAFAYFCYVFFILLSSLRLRVRNLPFSLFYGLSPHNIFSGGNDAQFVEFCDDSGIEPLMREGSFLIKSSIETVSSNQRFIYTKYPLLRLIEINGLTITQLLLTLISHISYFLFYLFSIVRYPPSVFLYRDFIDHTLYKILNNSNLIIDLIVTHSNFQYPLLPTWALPGRSFKTHMLWYSHSFYPLTEKDATSTPITGLNYVRVDKHWIWSDCAREFLSNLIPPSEIEICAPIVWQSYNSISSKVVTRSFKITLFDVTPFSDSWLTEQGVLVITLRLIIPKFIMM